uniref:Uncharacterized protein n=1 Tax=Sphaerodactylus townsendi TaxID=933632 RepID=A0ACB8G4T3_9SAUR
MHERGSGWESFPLPLPRVSGCRNKPRARALSALAQQEKVALRTNSGSCSRDTELSKALESDSSSAYPSPEE